MRQVDDALSAFDQVLVLRPTNIPALLGKVIFSANILFRIVGFTVPPFRRVFSILVDSTEKPLNYSNARLHSKQTPFLTHG